MGQEIEIWTDGAALPSNPGHMGLGVCWRDTAGGRTSQSWAYAGYGTSNKAELLAIHFALSVIAPSVKDRVTVYTDSVYVRDVITGIRRAWKHAMLVRALRDLLAGLRGHQIRLIRAHTGITENERADILAYQAASAVVHFGHVLPVYTWRPLGSPRIPAASCES